MAELRLQPEVRQTLELLLSPRLLQMLKILSLPYPELIEQVTKEAEENPLLEVERQDEYVEFLRYLTSDKKIKKEADFSELPGMENISNIEKTLEEHLLEQLELEDLEQKQHDIAKLIIENIDDFGYVINYPRLRDKIMAALSVSRPTVDKALKIVQTFEPEGVGARDLKECLLIQIREHSFDNEALQDILTKAVEHHLEDISEQNFAKVSQALGIPETGVVEIANFIKNNLNPNPGAGFGGEIRHVIPSFAVEKTDKGHKLVNLETRYGPRINLSSNYLKMLDNPKTDAKTKEFLKERLKKAKELLEAFSKRSETLEKIVRKITETQEAFLAKGVTWLMPLTQKSLADEFGLHPSTISRTVTQKYIQTPQGLFPLKFLCPRGPKGLTVGRTKAMLAEIVQNEDSRQPLTDSQITALMKQQGAKIDRRTVAYYRKELNFLPASERLKQ
ncbi:MAG: RNA polymerase factor sigma-54 [Candidatus Margulisiibacteriota bacterium]